MVEALTQRHPLFARATIERWVGQAFDSYCSAPVQAYVSILAQREVDARLRDLEASGPGGDGPARIGNGHVSSGRDVVGDAHARRRGLTAGS